MRTFNRIVTMLVLIALLIGLPVLAIMPDAVIGKLISWANGIQYLLCTGQVRNIIIVVAGLLWLLTVYLIWTEVQTPGSRDVRILSIGDGDATVSGSSVASLVDHRVSAVLGVSRAKSRVSQTKEGVVAELNLDVASGLRLPDVMSAATAAAREVLEGDIGARVARVDVYVKGLAKGPVHTATPVTPTVKTPAPVAPAPSVASVPPVEEADLPPVRESWHADAEEPKPLVTPPTPEAPCPVNTYQSFAGSAARDEAAAACPPEFEAAPKLDAETEDYPFSGVSEPEALDWDQPSLDTTLNCELPEDTSGDIAATAAQDVPWEGDVSDVVEFEDDNLEPEDLDDANV